MTTNLAEERSQTPLLQSILEYSSEISFSDDGKRKRTRRKHITDTPASPAAEGMTSATHRTSLPPMGSSVDLRNVRSLTNGRKPNQHARHRPPAHSRSMPVKTRNRNLFQKLFYNSTGDYNESSHDHSRYQDLERWLDEVKPHLSHDKKTSWQERPLNRVPYKFVKKKIGRSAWSQSSDGDKESIEIVSEGSRTITPQVEVVEITEDREIPDLGNSTAKKVSFNPQATIRVMSEAGFKITNSGRNTRSSDPLQWQKPDLLRRSKTDVNMLNFQNSRQNHNKPIWKLRKIKTQTDESDESNFGLDHCKSPYASDGRLNEQRPRQSIRCSCELIKILRTHPNITDKIMLSESMIGRRSRSPNSAGHMHGLWSFPTRSGSLDRSFSFTDHHLMLSNNPEIKIWLQRKNKLLRKKKKEESKLERKLLKEESEREKEMAAHRLENQEKVREWMKERQKELSRVQRKSRSRRRSSADDSFSVQKGKSASISKRSASSDRNANTDDTSVLKSSRLRTGQRLRSRSAPGAISRFDGKNRGKDDVTRRAQQRKRRDDQYWLRVNREDTADDIPAVKNDSSKQQKSKKKQRNRKDELPSDSNTINGIISRRNSSTRLDPQGCDSQGKDTDNSDRERIEGHEDDQDSVKKSHAPTKLKTGSRKNESDDNQIEFEERNSQDENYHEMKSEFSSSDKQHGEQTEYKNNRSDAGDSDSEINDKQSGHIDDSNEHRSNSRRSSQESNDQSYSKLRKSSRTQPPSIDEDETRYNTNTGKLHNGSDADSGNYREETLASHRSDAWSEKHDSPEHSARINSRKSSRVSDISQHDEKSSDRDDHIRTTSRQNSSDERNSYSQNSRHKTESNASLSPSNKSHQRISSPTARGVTSRNSVCSKHSDKDASPRQMSARGSVLDLGQGGEEMKDEHEESKDPVSQEHSRVSLVGKENGESFSRNSSHHSNIKEEKHFIGDRNVLSRNSNLDEDHKYSLHKGDRDAFSRSSDHHSYHADDAKSVHDEEISIKSGVAENDHHNKSKESLPSSDKERKGIVSRNSSHSSHRNKTSEHSDIIPSSARETKDISFKHFHQNNEDILLPKTEHRNSDSRNSGHHSEERNSARNDVGTPVSVSAQEKNVESRNSFSHHSDDEEVSFQTNQRNIGSRISNHSKHEKSSSNDAHSNHLPSSLNQAIAKAESAKAESANKEKSNIKD